MKKFQAVLLTLLCAIISGCSGAKANISQDIPQEEHKEANLKYEVFKYDEICKHPEYSIISNFEFNPRYDIFILKCCDFPKNQKYIMSMRRVAQKDQDAFKEIFRFTIVNENEWLISKGHAVPFYFVSTFGFGVGERITIRVETKSGKFRREIDLIANPIHVDSELKEFCLDATWIAFNPNIYDIRLTGLQEGEEVYFQSFNGPENLEDKMTYDSGGILFLPDRIGAQGGTCIYKITRKSGDSVIAHIPYGIKQASYMTGKLLYKN